MMWKDFLVREYAGNPFQVATNTLSLACLGIFVGHWIFHAPFGEDLVVAAMTPGLAAIVVAAILKHKNPPEKT
jgi:hypothetical protein